MGEATAPAQTEPMSMARAPARPTGPAGPAGRSESLPAECVVCAEGPGSAPCADWPKCPGCAGWLDWFECVDWLEVASAMRRSRWGWKGLDCRWSIPAASTEQVCVYEGGAKRLYDGSGSAGARGFQ